ncbi:ribose 5-phosphate isomerase A [Mucilaginibacter sp.]|jgi:ribose 5-phosphate isomerase A|uniref:ribose 5-phosphate isomerase A n=1 Tax=Mucilaginibacter sp. TaxID=1882438 RepID=UPI003566B89B
MTDYKIEAAKAALSLIKTGQTIGLGAGSTVAHLINLISQKTDLADSLIFTSSSFKTTSNLLEHGLRVQSPAQLKHLDVYFDGCDQFDKELNALKSGGGIHTTEKILASMANEFILMGDEGKFAEQLDTTYPLVIEVLPQAIQVVLLRLATDHPQAKVNLRMSTQKDGAVISENGNLLADIHFDKTIAPDILNIQIKMIPGIVDHSLFYRMATKAVIAGDKGIRTIYPNYNT